MLKNIKNKGSVFYSFLLIAILLIISSGISFGQSSDSITGVNLGMNSNSIVAQKFYTVDQQSAKLALEDIKTIRREMWDANVKFNGSTIRQAACSEGLETKSEYVNAIKWNSALERIAIQRGVETAQHGQIAHRRVNSENVFTAVYKDTMYNAESLAWGASISYSVLELWGRNEKTALNSNNGYANHDNGHLHTLLNPKLKFYGMCYLPSVRTDCEANGISTNYYKIATLAGAQAIFNGNQNSAGINGENIFKMAIPKSIAKAADYHNPNIVTEEIYEGEEINLTNNVTNLPSGASIQDVTNPPIVTTNAGNYKGKVQISYSDGSNKTLLINVKINEFEQINVRATDRIDVRSSVWGQKIGTLQKNQIVTAKGFRKDSYNNIWYKIEFNNSNAYILKRDTSTDLTPVDNFLVRLTADINVRDSVWGNKIGRLDDDKRKTVYGVRRDHSGNKWYRIWFNGNYAYIHSYYTSTKITYNVRLTSDVNYRLRPLGEIKGRLDNGTIKTVYRKKKDSNGDSWYKVYVNHNPYYIKAKYTSKKVTYNIRVTDKTYYRTSPWGTKVGSLYKNKIKTVYGAKKDGDSKMWYKVYVNHKPYYIYSLCTSKSLSKVNNYNVRLTATLSARKLPWGTIRGTISKNTVKTVYGSRKDISGNTWYRVWYNGGPAYIYAKYTK